ncbi:hypothetical protein ACAW74_09670 [Fibrella sp. WM1]|uniref:Lipoprotein n=1 Tax=Fibrella aestuarina BUZ 2 TaxID=1166018 RepID=I0K311_9BACT|nr:hypothetical protein [Fibrella aestuarina]CCG98514.1 hypothetical protein FAES_0503 [Fibrella aestuarina BUZ 2]
MKKLTMLAGAALLLTLGACSRKSACPAYGAAKPTKPAVTRAA